MLTFAEAKEIKLRDYQSAAIDGLRNKIREQQRRLILCAGTGAGKTVMAAHLLKEADRKGSYALFIVDRVALVDQTSAVLEYYGIRHGVVQGINRNWAPRENIQVCSAQTLARRSLPRSPNLIVVDEAHAQYKATLDLMAAHPDAVKIGLTATPFTKGMADHWDEVVNVIPTRRLIEDGFLVEPKIYVAKSPQDADLGLNSFGEFTDESAASAGIKIIGDVVSEWIGKTHEHFGGPVKTIVFSPTVEHGRELCAAFAAAGYNFQQISYLDKDDSERAAKIAEFRRPDSIIHGLVSCGVLTKGFDVPDCRIGISCKPYRKSLSSHMQEIGRVMRSIPGEQKKALWLCLARDSQVLTNRGLVCIQNVTRHDKVWDGENFVSHGGAICKGVQNVITYQGLTATPGHLVHTLDGWRTFGDCAREQVAITQTGFGRAPVRIGEDRVAGRALAWGAEAPVHPRRLRMRDLPLSIGRLAQQFARWANEGLSNLQPAGTGLPGMALCAGTGAEASLRQPEQRPISGLWWARDRVPVRGGEGRDALDNRQSRHPRGLQVQGLGPDRSGRPLRAGQPALAGAAPEPRQSHGRAGHGKDALVPSALSGGPLRGSHDEATDNVGPDFGAAFGEVAEVYLDQKQAEVWDILDAGPRNRFTCNGLLVHNCHSGNLERFAMEMFDVWENGAGDLSSATKRDTKPRERNEQVREKVVCPECSGALRGPTCTACGWQRPERSTVQTVEGELRAFSFSAIAEKARGGIRAECAKDPRKVWDAAVAYCSERSRDEIKARKWAKAVWHGVYPGATMPHGWFNATPREVDPNAYALIDRETRRFRKKTYAHRQAISASPFEGAPA